MRVGKLLLELLWLGLEYLGCAQGVAAYPALLRAELKELPPTRPPLRAASAGPTPMGPSACKTCCCCQTYKVSKTCHSSPNR